MLKANADAAARGVFDRMFGLVVEVVALQAATGRSQGGEVGKHRSMRDPPVRREDVWTAATT